MMAINWALLFISEAQNPTEPPALTFPSSLPLLSLFLAVPQGWGIQVDGAGALRMLGAGEGLHLEESGGC